MDDLTRRLYEERYSKPVRSKNSYEPQPVDPDGWRNLRALNEAISEDESCA